MKYLILVLSNPHFLERWDGLTDAQREEFGRRHFALTDELAVSGELIVSEGLADPALAKRVTVRDGRTTTTDGPFAEVKEHLAGFSSVAAIRPTGGRRRAGSRRRWGLWGAPGSTGALGRVIHTTVRVPAAGARRGRRHPRAAPRPVRRPARRGAGGAPGAALALADRRAPRHPTWLVLSLLRPAAHRHLAQRVRAGRREDTDAGARRARARPGVRPDAP